MGRKTWASKRHKTRTKNALSMKSLLFSIGCGAAARRAPRMRFPLGRHKTGGTVGGLSGEARVSDHIIPL